MKGIELARLYYEEYGKPMLEEQFGEYVGVIAVGLVGSGSECFGYDDALSQDHDFEPGFCLFLPDESVVDRKTAFQLERAYAKLPSEFMGFRRSPLSPVGGNRHGVLRMEDFFLEKTGTHNGELARSEWFTVPEQSLAEATNGAVFRDDLGWFCEIRERLSYLPGDVRLKKLAGNLFLMGQAGQYNFDRCIKRGERAAAQLAAGEFVTSAIKAIFLLNRKYLPYYKWQFRALSGLEKLSSLYGDLEAILTGENTDSAACRKQEIIDSVCKAITDEVRAQGLSYHCGNTMEGFAHSVNNMIEDTDLRNLHVLYGV